MQRGFLEMIPTNAANYDVPLLALFRWQVPHGDQSAGEPYEDLGGVGGVDAEGEV